MKKKILFIFGGKSSENKISIKSYQNIISKINKAKYNISSIYINNTGDWFKLNRISDMKSKFKIKINDIDFSKYDIVFPIIHGKNGEDGKMQGFLDIVNVPYVGCTTLTSAITMDKVATKEYLKNLGINQAKYIYTYNNYDLKDILLKIEKDINYPCYIKPSSCGSSIGITKVDNSSKVDSAIKEALKYDKKIIIEEEIRGREVEVGIIGNDEIIISCIGEIINEDFYSYDNKYRNNSTKLKIPAIINNIIEQNIKVIAKKIYKFFECTGLSRLDFFIEEKTNKIFFNEINTMPGFTNISMFPTLFLKSGIKYDVLIDKLILLALSKDR